MAQGNLPGYPANTPPLTPAQDCADVGPTLARHEQALASLCGVLEQLVGANEQGNAEFWAMQGCRATTDAVKMFVQQGDFTGNRAESCVEPFAPALPTLKGDCKAMLCGTVCYQLRNAIIRDGTATFGVSIDSAWSDGGIAQFNGGIITQPSYTMPVLRTETGTNTDGDPTFTTNISKRDGPVVCREFKDHVIDTDSITTGVIYNAVLTQCMVFIEQDVAPLNDDWYFEVTMSNMRLQVFCPVDFSTINV